MTQEKRIYTLGTSTRSLEEFFTILVHYRIDALADVRRFPNSRRYPHFARHRLETSAEKRGIQYHWLGELLGGFRKGGYDAFTTQPSFVAGLEAVERLAGKGIPALICAERLPWKCHRLKIARSLEERGWRVHHIIERDRLWNSHKSHSGAF